ncbi:MAG: CRISPR system precrRNA processing endoribonuclease RAMP protein Cas6 [Clostridiales bacterium]|nr:CRISPR system precrRNA processing endoribonuclease RAMP protein Cas6 [Clostridiales bacterium]
MGRSEFDIPYVKLHFILEMAEDTILPAQKTSALRGGLGQMLLGQNCIRDKKCGICPFQKDCVVWDTFYSRMERRPDYVTGKESVGYLIECTDRKTRFPAGSILGFRLTLFGSSIAFFNIYLQAFYYLGVAGLGANYSRFRIREVKNTEGESLVRGDMVDMQKYRIHMIRDYVERRKRTLRDGGDYIMTFRSLFCMKFQGEYLSRFSGEALVKGAARRIQMLNFYNEQEAELHEFAEFPDIREQEARYGKVQRYSSTQNSKVWLYGIRGRVVFLSMPEDCLDYLLAGELVHIGKNTSFGFGQYVMERRE